MAEDLYRNANPVALLVGGPGAEPERWARALVLRILETHGGARYRTQRLTGRRPARAARESIACALGCLDAPSRRFLLRVLLLVPWEMLRRDVGLTVRARDVLNSFAEAVSGAECAAAGKAVIEAGLDAVRKHPLDGVLTAERLPGMGSMLRLSARAQQELGLASACYEFDRVDVAARNFRPYSWESNLRAIVPWWLDRQTADAADRAAVGLLRRRCFEGDGAGRYRLLGLADWSRDHASQPAAATVLARCLDGRDGAVRKAAADLAAALEDTAVLAELAATDPDASVRRRAAKLLAASGA